MFEAKRPWIPLTLAAALLVCAAPAHAQLLCARDGDRGYDAQGLAARELAARPVRQGPKRPGTVAVRLLGLNDFHGSLPAGRLVAGRPVGSAEVLAAWLRAAAKGAEDRTLIVHAGDLVGASPAASALLQDEPTIALVNLLSNGHCRRLAARGERRDGGERYERWLDPRCNVVATVGNHEFDEGRLELLRLLGGGNHPAGPFLEDPWRGAAYPTLAANVVDEATSRPILPPFAVKWIDGIPVGFIGLVLKETPTIVTPTGVAGLRFLDEAETANRYVAKLRRQGVEAIVVVIHQGGSQRSYTGPTTAAGEVTGPIVGIVRRLDGAVDVVIAGHSHQFTNALLPSAGGKPVLVTQAFSSGTAFAQIDLEIDRKTRDVVARSAAIQTTWADEGPGLTPDPEAAALRAAAEARVAPLVNQVVGTADQAVTTGQDAAGESPMGDLVADAQRAAIPGAVAAFMNPGGVRAPLDAGDVTWGELFTIQPFGNTLVGLTLSGAQVKALLEQQWLGQMSPRVLQVSGIAYSWSASAPAGSKVSGVVIGGAPLDLAASYRVVVNNFIAAGGDNFTVLTAGADPIGGPVDLDALITYVRARPQPFPLAAGARITQVP